jgi:ZIP family zinc transporter
MTSIYVTVILLSLLSCVTTCLGVGLALLMRESPRSIAVGIGFSVGIMVLISVLELIPESIASMGTARVLTGALVGALLVWLAHVLIPNFHLIKGNGITDRAHFKSAYLMVFGLILHDVPEGFAMANAYVSSPALGVIVALAIGLHNLPEEFAMAVPIVTLRSKRFLFNAALLSALAEPAGAVIGLIAAFMALAAGAMIFVSIHELIPFARRYGHIGHFLMGLMLSALVMWLLASFIGSHAIR